MVASKKHCQDQLDGNGHGHSLLSFMKLASTKVKTALEKPNSFKRNINHRRFLQKQFKALVKKPEKIPTRKQCNLAKESMMQQLDFSPPCHNQMPPSPVNRSPLPFAPMAMAMQPFIPAMDLQQTNAHPFVNPTLSNVCERRYCDYDTSKVRDTTYYNSSLPELVTEEDGFLTGEELTQAIELKDLFIPETDLLQYLNIKDSLDILNDDETNPNFDSWICREFLSNDRAVY